MKATEQYFPVVLFILLYKVVLTFDSVDQILWCDHSNETSSAVLLHGTSYFSIFYKMKFGFLLNSNVWHSWKLKGLTGWKERFLQWNETPRALSCAF